MTTTEVAPRRLDMRLVPSAVICWAATLFGILFGWKVGLGIATGMAVAALASRTVSTKVRVGVLAALLLGMGFAGATALRVQALDDHPLRTAPEGSHVTVSMVLSDDPKRLRPKKAVAAAIPERMLVRAEIREVRIGGAAHRVGGNVVVLAPAGGWKGLLPGQGVTVRGKVGPPLRHDLSVATIRVNGPPTGTRTAPWIQRVAGEVRHRFATAADAGLSSDAAGLLPAMVVGDTSGLSAEVEDNFRVAGLSHLTAVSGANVSIILGAVLLCVRGLGLGPRTGVALAVVALAMFVLLARPSPSVLRAAVMGAIGLLALITGRRKQALPALGGAVIVLLALYPALAVDYGFALSVVATAGLVVLAPSWADWLRARGWPRAPAEMVAVAGAAWAVTTPIVVGMSGTVSAVSIGANLLAAVVVAPITVIGVVVAICASIGLPFAGVLAWPTAPLLWWLIRLADKAAGLPGAAIRVPAGAGPAVVCALVVAVAIAVIRVRVIRCLVAAVVIGAVAVFVPLKLYEPGWPPKGWVLVACDVGQGDGLVLATGDGRAIVVDVGPDPRSMRMCLDRLGVSRIALLVLSHLHADHIGGLASVLRGRSVAGVAVGPMKLPAAAYRDVVDATVRARVPLLQMESGQRLRIGGVGLQVLAPLLPAPRDPTDADGAANDQSLVLGVDTRVGRILLTGDAEVSAQEAMLRARAPLRADILKVPHHGSRTTVDRFLGAVAPRIALVSVGADNTFGHPNPKIMAELSAGGATVVRTDLVGDIAIVGTSSGPSVVGRENRATIVP